MSLGFKSNFLSNVNLMILFLLVPPLVWGILTLVGRNNQSYKTRPRLLRQAKIFLCEMSFSILMFNSFNIYISTIINFQEWGTNNILSLFVSMVLVLLVPAIGVLYAVYKKHFVEFTGAFGFSDFIGKLDIRLSTQIKSMYPLCIMIEMVTIPLFLGI